MIEKAAASMTQVNFYALSNKDPSARVHFACRLTDKARDMGHRVFIHTATSAQAKLMDDLLWQFRESSFLPHQLLTATDAPAADVQIAASPAPADFNDILINLSDTVCENHAQFGRIYEIVGGDEDAIKRGRERYRFYRDSGVSLDNFKI